MGHEPHHEQAVKDAHGVPAKLDALIVNAGKIIDGMEADLNSGRSVVDVCAEARQHLAALAARKHEIS